MHYFFAIGNFVMHQQYFKLNMYEYININIIIKYNYNYIIIKNILSIFRCDMR